MANSVATRNSRYGLFLLLALSAPKVLAQGKGEGGVVLRDEAPVFVHSEGDKVEAKGMRGDYVVGVTTLGILGEHYQFEPENGRVHVRYFANKKQAGTHRTGWMNPDDLSTFTYDCGCDRKGKCSPFMISGFSFTWNTCFKEGRDNKLGQLKEQWAKGTKEATAATAGEPASAAADASEKPLTNDQVVALFKAGLGDDLVVAKIQQTPREALDVSIDSLIKLKKDGLSKPVLDAMVKRAGQRK